MIEMMKQELYTMRLIIISYQKTTMTLIRLFFTFLLTNLGLQIKIVDNAVYNPVSNKPA